MCCPLCVAYLPLARHSFIIYNTTEVPYKRICTYIREYAVADARRVMVEADGAVASSSLFVLRVT
jgi:hypothetical protein